LRLPEELQDEPNNLAPLHPQQIFLVAILANTACLILSVSRSQYKTNIDLRSSWSELHSHHHDQKVYMD
jgi:hypothetical protein